MERLQTTRDMFASIAGRATRCVQDALTKYLEAPPRATVKDPLAYWNAALASHSEDPALVRMALDYLSIPGECWLACTLVMQSGLNRSILRPQPLPSTLNAPSPVVA